MSKPAPAAIDAIRSIVFVGGIMIFGATMSRTMVAKENEETGSGDNVPLYGFLAFFVATVIATIILVIVSELALHYMYERNGEIWSWVPLLKGTYAKTWWDVCYLGLGILAVMLCIYIPPIVSSSVRTMFPIWSSFVGDNGTFSEDNGMNGSHARRFMMDSIVVSIILIIPIIYSNLPK
jgi:hypothetical protein